MKHSVRVNSKPRRRGATLTEVLMALGISSIGLVSIMSLFPIAVVRSLQATRLTRATALVANAESMIDLYPQLIHNPDGDLDPRAGQLGNSYVTLAHNVNENYNENVFNIGINILDNGEDDGIANTPPGHVADNANGFLDRPNYIVDPLGWSQIGLVGYRNYFGNNGTTAIQWLRRFNGGVFSAIAPNHSFPADRIVTSPDIWAPAFDEVPVSLQANSVTVGTNTNLSTIPLFEDANLNLTLDAGEDLNGNGILDLANSRVVLFGRDSRWSDQRALMSHTRVISNVNGQNIQWANALDTTNFQVERIRVETQQKSFTWMLTVRQTLGANPPKANVDVVVFHNRTFSPEDERPYQSPIPPGPGAYAPGMPTVTPPLPQRSLAFESGRPDSNVVVVTYIDQSTFPFIRKGGYVLDLINANWYQILDFKDDKPGTVPNTGLGVLTITIDRPAEGNGSLAVFMRGIVRVFPLGAK